MIQRSKVKCDGKDSFLDWLIAGEKMTDLETQKPFFSCENIKFETKCVWVVVRN